MSRRALCVLLVAAAACSKPAPPAPPAARTPEQLAGALHGSLVELAAITHQYRARCPELAVRLDRLFARMRVDLDAALVLSDDPASAQALVAAMKRYDARIAGLSEQISADLVGCKDHAAVRAAMTRMPTL